MCPFLGLSDSRLDKKLKTRRQEEDKKLKFKDLRESILSQETVDLKLCSVLQAKPPRSLLQFPQLGFTLVPRFVLSRPILNHPTTPLRSQATYQEKSNIGDFWITGKAAFPVMTRGIFS